MATPADQAFFAASMGAAATLLGLLFVAVSVAPERTVGSRAPVERQVVAESVFTALINAFLVSMAATVPEINLGSIALPLSAFALLQSLRVGWKLWPRPLTARPVVQRLGLVVVALVIYGIQFRDATLLLNPLAPETSVGNEIAVLFALYVFALGRSWELLGARRGILVGRLSPIPPIADGPSTAARPEQGRALVHPKQRPHQRTRWSTSESPRRLGRSGRTGDVARVSRTRTMPRACKVIADQRIAGGPFASLQCH